MPEQPTTDWTVSGGPGRTARRALALGVAVAALVVLVVAGTLVTPQAATFRPDPVPLVGRTSAVCSATPLRSEGEDTTTVTAVVSRQAPGRDGRLIAGKIGVVAELPLRE